jgi:hypothetical protein
MEFKNIADTVMEFGNIADTVMNKRNLYINYTSGKLLLCLFTKNNNLSY